MKRKLSEKIMRLDEAVELRKRLRRDFVFTNGCFDILHSGHCLFLERAASLAPFMMVAVNSDASVRTLKGAKRPINAQTHRMEVIAALEVVDVVVLLDAVRCDDLLRIVAPSIWAKSGYTLETLNKSEVSAAMEVGAEIVLLPEIKGRSTTAVIEALCRSNNEVTT